MLSNQEWGQCNFFCTLRAVPPDILVAGEKLTGGERSVPFRLPCAQTTILFVQFLVSTWRVFSFSMFSRHRSTQVRKAHFCKCTLPTVNYKAEKKMHSTTKRKRDLSCTLFHIKRKTKCMSLPLKSCYSWSLQFRKSLLLLILSFAWSRVCFAIGPFYNYMKSINHQSLLSDGNQ